MTPVDFFARGATEGVESAPSVFFYVAIPMLLACLVVLAALLVDGWPALRRYFAERRARLVRRARSEAGVLDIEDARVRRFIREEKRAGRVK